jgi:hypothetical protein
LFHLGQWGNGAPLPEGAHVGLDSLMLALQAAADPALVTGRYEVRARGGTFTVDGTAGSVRIRRGTADEPAATLATDDDTLAAACFGQRSIADAARSGDLRVDGDPAAVSGLTSLLLALLSAAPARSAS